jgi:hypothetical protein
MKKILIILVAFIGFGISASAQKAYVSGDPTVRVDGERVVITVPIAVDFGTVSDQINCRAVVKVCPKSRELLDALYINCEWTGTISYNRKTEYGSAVFSCSVKDSSVPQRCGAYDFEVSAPEFTYCN